MCPMYPTRWFLATILSLAVFVGGAEAADDSLRTVSAASSSSRSDAVDSCGMMLVSGTPTQDFTVDSIVAFLNNGGVNDTVTVILCDDNTDSPNNVLRKSLDTLVVTNGSGTDGRYKFRLTYSVLSGVRYWFGVVNLNLSDAASNVNVRHSGGSPSSARVAIQQTPLATIPAAVTGETMYNGLDYLKIALYGHTGSGATVTKVILGNVRVGGVKL